MPFTSFCLFLSLLLSHFSLLLSFSLDFFFLVLFKDSIYANFSVECPGTNTGASQRARTQISLPLCGDLFSFLANFQPASKWHGKRDISQSSLKCSSVHCCMKKNCCVWFGRLERFDQWSLFLQTFGAQLQFDLSRGTVRRWLGFLPYFFDSPDLLVLVSDELKQLFSPEPGAKRWQCFILTAQRRFFQAFSIKKQFYQSVHCAYTVCLLLLQNWFCIQHRQHIGKSWMVWCNQWNGIDKNTCAWWENARAGHKGFCKWLQTQG